MSRLCAGVIATSGRLPGRCPRAGETDDAVSGPTGAAAVPRAEYGLG